MSKQEIRHLIETHLAQDGVIDTPVKGVQLFRVTQPVPCEPAIYEPALVAIVSGAKQAILVGRKIVYDHSGICFVR